jgi:hypothetical protein
MPFLPSLTWCGPLRHKPWQCHCHSGYSTNTMRYSTSEGLHLLFVVNIGLQVWDGLATYQGVQLGWPEGNPLVRAMIMQWGEGWALLGAKFIACVLLLLLRRLQTHPLIPQALTLTAAWYVSFSFLPWLVLLIPHWFG